MSNELFVWIIGSCTVVAAAALVAQGWAAFSMMGAILPLFQKSNRLAVRGGHLVQEVEKTIRATQPIIAATMQKAGEVRTGAGTEILLVKTQCADASDIVHRVSSKLKGFRPKQLKG